VCVQHIILVPTYVRILRSEESSNYYGTNSYWLGVHNIISVPRCPPHVGAWSDVGTDLSTMAPSTYWLCVRSTSHLCPHHLLHMSTHAQIWRLIQVLWHLSATDCVCVHHIISPNMSELARMWRLVQVIWQVRATDCVCEPHHILAHVCAHAQMRRLVQLIWHLPATDWLRAPYHNCGHMSELAQMWRLVQVLCQQAATDCESTTPYLWPYHPTCLSKLRYEYLSKYYGT
jgi:hypothetical protein